jgi:hypothetical protein
MYIRTSIGSTAKENHLPGTVRHSTVTLTSSVYFYTPREAYKPHLGTAQTYSKCAENPNAILTPGQTSLFFRIKHI